MNACGVTFTSPDLGQPAPENMMIPIIFNRAAYEANPLDPNAINTIAPSGSIMSVLLFQSVDPMGAPIAYATTDYAP